MWLARKEAGRMTQGERSRKAREKWERLVSEQAPAGAGAWIEAVKKFPRAVNVLLTSSGWAKRFLM